MGSFSWLCSDCKHPIVGPWHETRGEVGECVKCLDTLYGVEEVTLLMPDDEHIVGEYTGYGGIEIDDKEVIDFYGWLARANLPQEFDHMPDEPCCEKAAAKFWKATRVAPPGYDHSEDADRYAGIDLTHDKGSPPINYPIKVVHSRCLHEAQAGYDNYDESESDDGQGSVGYHKEGQLFLCPECWGW